MTLRADLLARIAYWREQERKATPGPWSHDGHPNDFTLWGQKCSPALIVAARNAWPKVLEMAEAEITKHRHIDPWRKHPPRQVGWPPCPVLLRWSDVIPPIPGGEV